MSCYNPCNSNTAIEQAVDDALAERVGELEGYKDSAASSANNAAQSATEAANHALEAKGYRDETQTIANTASGLVPDLLEASNNIKETAETLEEISRTASSFLVRNLYYTVVGNEKSLVFPESEKVSTVQAIYIEGIRQDAGYGYSYDAVTRTLTFAEKFSPDQAGVVITIQVGQTNADSPETVLSSLASNSGAGLVGTSENKSVQAVLNDHKNAIALNQQSINKLNTDVSGLEIAVGIESDRVSALMADTGSSLIKYKFSSDLVETQAHSLASVMKSFVRIEDFYLDADAGDYALAFNRAALHYKDAAGMAIIFGPNTYNFNTRAIYDGSANILLIGQGSSTINLNSPLNAANLSIKSVRKITIENIEFNVTEPTTGTKVAIYANCTGQDQSHNFRNVRVVPNIVTSGKGVICYDIMNPALSTFTSCYVRYFGTSLVSGSNNISWRIAANAKISTDSMFSNCAIVGGEIAYLVTPPVLGTNGAALEGITWLSCTVVGSLEGVFIQGDASNGYRSPMYRWIGGHISTYKRCFFAYWVSQISITDCFYYLTYDASLSGSGGLFPIFLEQCIEQRVHNASLHLFGQDTYTGSETSQGVHVGPGCRFTSLRDISTYTPAKAFGVATYGGSSLTRVRDCVTFYAGVAPAAVFSFAGTGDVDLGGNNVYPA